MSSVLRQFISGVLNKRKKNLLPNVYCMTTSACLCLLCCSYDKAAFSEHSQYHCIEPHSLKCEKTAKFNYTRFPKTVLTKLQTTHWWSKDEGNLFQSCLRALWFPILENKWEPINCSPKKYLFWFALLLLFVGFFLE